MPPVSRRHLLIATGMAPLAGWAQDAGYAPTLGQDGKDVIWAPTPDAMVERMLRLAGLRPSDVVVDLGAGDGKIVIAAARAGARGGHRVQRRAGGARAAPRAGGRSGRARASSGPISSSTTSRTPASSRCTCCRA